MAPILTNHGATPLDVGFRRWIVLLSKDVGLWVAKMIGTLVPAIKSWRVREDVYPKGFHPIKYIFSALPHFVGILILGSVMFPIIFVIGLLLVPIRILQLTYRFVKSSLSPISRIKNNIISLQRKQRIEGAKNKFLAAKNKKEQDAAAMLLKSYGIEPELIETTPLEEVTKPIEAAGLKKTAIGMGLAGIATAVATYITRDMTALPIILGIAAGYALITAIMSLITRRYIVRALGERAGPIAWTITNPDGTKYIETAPEFNNLPKFIQTLILLHERAHLAGFGEIVAYTLPLLSLYNAKFVGKPTAAQPSPEDPAMLTARYNSIDKDFQENGIDVQKFYDNPDYFIKDQNGKSVAVTTPLPLICVWPIMEYSGGESLLAKLSPIKNRINKILGEDNVSWGDTDNLHSTIYSVVKTPTANAMEKADKDKDVIQSKAKELLAAAEAYRINFNRIMVGSDGTIFVVGYVYDNKLTVLRNGLKREIPQGHRTNIVHITLGRIINNPSVAAQAELKEFVRRYRDIYLNTITVDSAVYANYIGPATKPYVKKIYRQKFLTESQAIIINKIKEHKISFVMIKPDGIKNKGEILNMLKEKGLEIVYQGQPVTLNRGQAEEFYSGHKGQPYYEGLVNYITSGEVIPVLVRSNEEDAVGAVRKVVGPTKGVDVNGIIQSGTIRGRFMTDEGRKAQPITNVIHASDSIYNVSREASIPLGEGELLRILEQYAHYKKEKSVVADGVTTAGTAIGKAVFFASTDGVDIEYSFTADKADAEIKKFEKLLVDVQAVMEKIFKNNEKDKIKYEGIINNYAGKIIENIEAVKNTPDVVLTNPLDTLIKELKSYRHSSAYGRRSREMIDIIIGTIHEMSFVSVGLNGRSLKDEYEIGKDALEYVRKQKGEALSLARAKSENAKKAIKALDKRNKNFEKDLAGEEAKGKDADLYIIKDLNNNIAENKKAVKTAGAIIEAAEIMNSVYMMVDEAYQRYIDPVQGGNEKEKAVIERMNRERKNFSSIMYEDFICDPKRALVACAGKEDENAKHFKATCADAIQTMISVTDRIMAQERKAKIHIGGAEKDNWILFITEPISAEQIEHVMQEYGDKIKGIVTTSATLGSHWVIVAHRYPIACINGEEFEKLGVEIGNTVIVSSVEEGEIEKTEVVANPVPGTEYRYLKHQIEQERYNAMTLRHKSVKTKNPIYANITPGDALALLEQYRVDGIGLIRTEIWDDTFNNLMLSIIKEMNDGALISSPEIRAHIEDSEILMLRQYSEIVNAPYMKDKVSTFRTFDLSPDKNAEIINATGVKGFDLYRKPLGKALLIGQMASIIAARFVDKAGRFRPDEERPNIRIMFPMVKSTEDLDYIFKNEDNEGKTIMQRAIDEAAVIVSSYPGITKIEKKAVVSKGAKEIEFGVMIETLEAVDNLDSILGYKGIKFGSVGTNDLTSAIFAKVFKDLVDFEVLVDRDDPVFNHLFAVLKLEVVKALDKIADKFSLFNREHAGANKILGLCGQIVGKDKAQGIIERLRRSHKNVPIYVSEDTEHVPASRFLAKKLEDISDEEIMSIFGDLNRNGIDPRAISFVNKIIKKSPEYKEEVLGESEQQKLLIGILAESKDHNSMREAIRSVAGKKGIGGIVKDVVFVAGHEDLARLSKETGAIGVFIDSSVPLESVGEDKFVKDLLAIKLSKDCETIFAVNNISDATRREIAGVIKEMIPNIESINAADIFERVQELLDKAPDTRNQINRLAELITNRRNEIELAYNNMSMDESRQYNNRIAIATTERIAECDPFSAQNAEKAGRQSVVNCFIYGDNITTLEDAKKFVAASGYKGDIDKMHFIDKSALSYEELVGKIAAETGVSPANIGIRAGAGELLTAGEKPVIGRLLEIQSITIKGKEMYAAVNSYQALLKILTNITDGLAVKDMTIPGVSYDSARGIFRYLPKVLPIDYGEEIEVYRNAVRIIASAA